MINPLLVVVVLSATLATGLTIAITGVVIASRLGVVLDVAINILDMLERDHKRLLRIRKLRQILAAGHRLNGSQPPVIYAPRHRYQEGAE
jgi:hypothetical protein